MGWSCETTGRERQSDERGFKKLFELIVKAGKAHEVMQASKYPCITAAI